MTAEEPAERTPATSSDAGTGGPDDGGWVGGPPWQLRWAAVLVGVQGLVALAFAVALLVRAGSADLPLVDVLGESVFFVVVAAALVAVCVGLLTGRRGARTPAIVVQLLLLPVVYSLLGPSRQVLWGVVSGVVVAGAFLLLISEASRAWSMDLPGPPRR